MGEDSAKKMEYHVRIDLKRNIANDLGIAMEEFPDHNGDFPSILSSLVKKEMEGYLDEFGGDIEDVQVFIPNSDLEGRNNKTYAEEAALLKSIIFSNQSSEEEREKAFNVLISLFENKLINNPFCTIQISEGKLSVTLSQDDFKIIKDFMLEGKKICAIRKIREITSFSLLEAKTLVESVDMTRQINQ